jgi:hypothetical protein
MYQWPEWVCCKAQHRTPATRHRTEQDSPMSSPLGEVGGIVTRRYVLCRACCHVLEQSHWVMHPAFTQQHYI